jgi:hypothetical protein
MTPGPAPEPGGETPLSKRAMLWMLLGILGTFGSQFSWVRATNFGGIDEWLCISLASQGILDFPYANRPLVLLWALPAAKGLPHDLLGYYLVHAAYLVIAGWFVFFLCRHVAPRSPHLGFLAGVIAVVWAPLDFLRLDVVLLIYSGLTVGTLLSMLLLLTSWRRRSPPILALGMLVGFVAARGYEGVVPLLFAAPLLLATEMGDQRRRFWAWVAAWESVVLLAVVLIVLPFLQPPGSGSYQGSGLGLDPNPWRVLVRLAQQYAYHLLPLVTTPVRELAVPAAAISVAVFALAHRLARRSGPNALDGPEARGRLLALLGVGLLLAGLGYSLFTLSPAIQTAARTQFLSSPGMGIGLAAGVGWVVTWLPARWRSLGVMVLGSWIVAVGTARTVAMQREWDESIGRFPAQHRTLAQLTELAPRLVPHTLVVLIDDAGAWPATLTFRHAVEYLYPGQGSGLVWGAEEFLYPAHFGPQGIFCVPWPILWRAWNTGPTLHGYDQVVVVGLSAAQKLFLWERWPPALPPLPAGATYAPRSRFEMQGPLPPERAILKRGP